MDLAIQSSREQLESERGFALRLSELNGFDRPPFRLATLYDARTERSAAARRYEALPASMQIEGRARICPDCLGEKLFTRLHWQIKPYIACHVHERLLVDDCSACGKLLSWRRPGLLRCCCGASLISAPRILASPNQIFVASRIDRQITGPVSGSNAVPVKPDIATIATLSWFFGIEASRTKWRSAYLAKPAVLASRDIIERGGRMLRDWPHSFDNWLRARLRIEGETSLYFWLRRLRSALPNDTAGVMELAIQFLDEQTGITPLRRDALFATRQSWIVAADAARQLGVTNATVAAFVDSGQLEARTVRRAERSIRQVSEKSLAALRARLAQEISSQAAIGRLNVSRPQLCRLRREGIIEARRHGTWWRYDVASIERLEQQLAAIAELHPTGATVPLTEAGRNWCLPVDRLVLDALSGRRQIYRGARSEGGLSAFVIERPAQANRAGNCMSFRQAASELKVAQRMIGILVSAGCLVQTTEKGRPAIVRTSLVLCKAQFVTSAAIAKATGTNTRSVIARLKAQGIVPVVRGDSFRGISFVWPRCAIVNEILR